MRRGPDVTMAAMEQEQRKTSGSDGDDDGKGGTERKRGKGRPQQAGDAVGRERILEFAADFLRQHSLAELTTAGVAKAAGVDPALVRYYFGTKEGLLTELVSKLTEERTTAGLRFLSDTSPIEERFKRRVKAMLDANADNPVYHELLVARIFKRDDPAAQMVLDDLARRATHLANKLIADGGLRPVDPAFLHIMLVGACSFFITSRPFVDVLRQKKTTDRTLDAYAEFVVDVLLQGLRPRGGAEGPSPARTPE